LELAATRRAVRAFIPADHGFFGSAQSTSGETRAEEATLLRLDVS
jgi:hypothetical protein